MSLKIIGKTRNLDTTQQSGPFSEHRITATTLYFLAVFFSYLAPLRRQKIPPSVFESTAATCVSNVNRLFTNTRRNKWQFWPKHFCDKIYTMYVCFRRSRERMHYFALHGCLNIQFIYEARVENENNIFFYLSKNVLSSLGSFHINKRFGVSFTSTATRKSVNWNENVFEKKRWI